MFLPSCFSIFFICDDLPFINTIQKTLKPSKKIFQCPGWMRKNFIPGNFSWRVVAETWDASCFKKGFLEKQQCSKHLHYLATEKDILSELNRCIFQISIKYIKLLIPKILFLLVLCSFNFYFKIMWPPKQNYPHPPQKNKVSDPPPAKTFLKSLTLTPPPSKLEVGVGGCMPWLFCSAAK